MMPCHEHMNGMVSNSMDQKYDSDTNNSKKYKGACLV